MTGLEKLIEWWGNEGATNGREMCVSEILAKATTLLLQEQADQAETDKIMRAYKEPPMEQSKPPANADLVGELGNFASRLYDVRVPVYGPEVSAELVKILSRYRPAVDTKGKI